ncbi:hypothetical protein [Natronococcus occultus]|uniref:Uncharacterized protein n=1 Tax=Natronococcus occultus SP4 TaxID=694430 RepID=L0JWC0_9EURY|nr:hypothetical protein [Natronococcus occultus]AGB37302.1 hypothetical protein Natoc_1492 [Natronococcus occultus SP4]
MKTRVHHATLFALYQLSIVVGILMMPLAMATRQAGYTLPIHRLIETVGEAYDDVNQE